MQNLLEELNNKQKEAVENTEGPVLVIAGAGSGKTKVLTHKIAYDIESGIKPWNILAITFTNKAANEMKERIEKLIGDAAKDLWMGTFHSICVRILRRYIDRIGYKTDFVIFDTSDQKTLIKECLKTLKVDDKIFTDRGVLSEISNGKNDAEVMTLDNNKISILKEIFWKMNEITSSTEEVTDKDNKKKIVLHINVNGKDALEMAQKYNFSIEQNKQLAELLDKQYSSLWLSVIYGSSVGNTDIVEVAKKQIGNIGGQPFWSWYGYNSRVEWCACFVSWCANECGYIEAGIIPKFASCESEGVAWFKTCGLWQEKGYTPKSGDIIFFDWADSNDGLADHVGIVSRVENGIIYTVEGNTRGDVCKENKYSIDSSVIRGFGTPAYK